MSTIGTVATRSVSWHTFQLLPREAPPALDDDVARETLAASEKLGGPAYLEAFGSDKVQAALETINGNGSSEATPDAIEAIATELDPRTEDEIRASEGDAA